MKTYQFKIEVTANSQLEAEVKLKLLLDLGAFFKDFDASKLTNSFLNYYLLYLADKYGIKVNDADSNKKR